MTLRFKHSGRLGDILYSLPLLQEMSKIECSPVDLYIGNDVPARLGADVFHPSLDVMVNTALFQYIHPLLARQTYINKVEHIASLEIPSDVIDLDKFKESGLNLKAGLIHGWYRKAFGLPFPLEKAWLHIDILNANDALRDYDVDVLVSRTTRFCNTRINYSFLDQIEGVGFIGMPYEYDDFISRHALKRVRHVRVENAFDLAVLMRRAKVFIGNQSSNFAIAEGLKVTRALEAFEPVPVATPVGGLCFEYINTKFLVDFLSSILTIPLDAPKDIVGGDYYDSIKSQVGYVLPLKQRLKNLLGIARKPRY